MYFHYPGSFCRARHHLSFDLAFDIEDRADALKRLQSNRKCHLFAERLVSATAALSASSTNVRLPWLQQAASSALVRALGA